MLTVVYSEQPSRYRDVIIPPMAPSAETERYNFKWREKVERSDWDSKTPAERQSCFQDPQKSTMINKKTTWKANGWVMKYYDEVVAPGIKHCLEKYVREICGSSKFGGSYYCRLIGIDVNSARPSIVIRDPDSALRKRFANVLKVQLWYLQSGFGIHDEPGPLRPSVELSASGFHDGQVENNFVGFMPPSLLGRAFHVPSIHDSGGRRATIAAIIRAYGHDYALTVAHCFADHDEEIDEMVLGSRPMQLVCSEPEFQQYFKGVRTTSSQVIVGCAQLNLEETHSTVRDWSLASELNGPCAFNRFQEDLGLDQLQELSVPPDGTVIVLSQEQESYRRTTASGEVCLISIPGVMSLQRVYAIDTSPDPVESEPQFHFRSGSLVINEVGEAFGIVVASAPDLNTTYVMPLSKIFDDISESLCPSAESELERPCFAPFLPMTTIESHVSSYEFLKQALKALEIECRAWTAVIENGRRLKDKLSSVLRQTINHEWQKEPQLENRHWLYWLQWQLDTVLRIDPTGSSPPMRFEKLTFLSLQQKLEDPAFLSFYGFDYETRLVQSDVEAQRPSLFNFVDLKGITETDNDSTYSSMPGTNYAPSVGIEASSTASLHATRPSRMHRIKQELSSYARQLQMCGVQTIHSSDMSILDELIEQSLFEHQAITQQSIQGTRVLFEDFLRSTEVIGTMSEFEKTLESFRDKLNMTLPNLGANTLTQADLKADLRVARDADEVTAERTILMSAIDRWRLDAKFGFDCRRLWILGQDLVLPVQFSNKASTSFDSLPHLKPSLSIFFQKSHLLDSQLESLDSFISQDLWSCCDPTRSSSHLFPFLFIEVARQGSPEAKLYSCLHTASQSLYNVYNFMNAAGDLSPFEKVRTFSIILSTYNVTLRTHWAEVSPFGNLIFHFKIIDERYILNAQTPSIIVHNILRGYASTTLFPILKKAWAKLALSTMRAAVGTAAVAKMLKKHPEIAALVEDNDQIEAEEDSAQTHVAEKKKRAHSPAVTSLVEGAHKRSREASVEPPDSGDLDMEPDSSL